MTKLFQYQKDGIRRLIHFGGRGCLFDEMGLGKTIQALAVAKYFDAFPCVVVCPASVKYTWEAEASQHYGIRGIVLEGTKPPRRGLRLPAQLWILNFDILHKWVQWLREMGIKCAIIDECQNISNRETIRTKSVKMLCEDVPHVIALSGTPLMNRPAELYPTINLVCPDEFNGFFDFGMRYCEPKKVRGEFQFKGAANLDELNQRLNDSCMVRRLKRDVLIELPSKMRRQVPVQLRDFDQYEEARDNFVKWIYEKHPTRAKTALYNQAFTQLGYLLRLTAKLKFRAVCNWIDDFLGGTDEKLIVFGVHKAMVKSLNKRYLDRSVLIDGDVPSKIRKLMVDQFQRDVKTRLFIGNGAATAGITLTAASTVAFVEYFWRPADHLQAEDRPHRIGQHKTVWVNYLTAIGTIEERMCQIVQRKQEHCRKTLDGEHAGEELAVCDLLIEHLKKGKR